MYVEQKQLNGTGGALRGAQPFIRSDRFLTLNGDDLYGADDLAALTQNNRGVLVQTKTLHKEMDTWHIDDGRIRALATTRAHEIGAINIGAYLLGHEWFATKPILVPTKTTEWSLPHAIPDLLTT